jgi:hypothetical protein
MGTNCPWETVVEPARSELCAIFADLLAEVGDATPVARRWAKMTAEVWAVAGSLSQEAAVLAIRRRTGRGRRPTRAVVSQAAKRQALEIDSADKALRGLRDLAGRKGQPAADDDLRDRMLSLPRLSPDSAETEV